MTATGPSFISLQVRDRERSASFYERYLGFARAESSPPTAVVFDTAPISFAIRDVAPGVDLDRVTEPGIGAAIWFHAADTQEIHDAMDGAGVTIVSAPSDGPFGRTFTFADPDGYRITLHDRV